jgi:NAD(P)-dependent dehydrogenase (short-subunit alcohol dehydrogenase family)
MSQPSSTRSCTHKFAQFAVSTHRLLLSFTIRWNLSDPSNAFDRSLVVMSQSSQKWAIVTGASGGIGAAVAQRLAKDGMAVVVNYAGNASRANLAPLQRLGTPEEIADVVSFLAGPDGRWVNAQVLRANGGFA